MAHHRLVVRTARPVTLRRCRFPVILTVVLLLLLLSTRGFPADEPDLEAFRAAKQAYFKKPAQAAELFTKFLTDYRQSKWIPEACYWLAKSLETAKADRSKVIKAYTFFLRRYPNHELSDEATFAIAELYRNRRRNRGELRKALDRYLKFVKTYPDSDRVPEAYFKIGDLQATLKQHDKALEAFRKVTTDFAESSFAVPARIGEAKCLHRLRKFDEAIAAYGKLLKLTLNDSDRLKVHLALLSCYLDSDRLQEALTEAGKIRSKTDSRSSRQGWAVLDSYRRVASYYQRKKDYPKAVAEMSEYIKRFGNSPGVWSAHFAMGDIYLSARQYRQARAEFEKIICKHPKTNDKRRPDIIIYALYRRAYSYEREKNYAKAVTLYEALVADHPKTWQARNATRRIVVLKKKIASQKQPAP